MTGGAGRIEDRFGDAAGIVAESRPGLTRARDVPSWTRGSWRQDATRVSCRPIAVTHEVTLAEHSDRLEAGLYSWTWGIDDATAATPR
jgi:hypothetical protein